MKSTTFILFAALLVAPSMAQLGKGAYNQAALAGASRSPVAAGRLATKTAPPQDFQQVQQKFTEEDDESALLAAQRQRPRPQPPAPTPAPYVPPPQPAPRPPAPAPYVPPPQPAPRPAPRPYQPAPQVAAPIRPRPQPPAPRPVPVEVPEGPHPAPEPYSFSYSVNDQESGAALSREESQDANGNVVGFYHITDAEGRLRRVDYTAGPEGFKATIQSNEEGLAAKNSADATYNVQEVSAEKQQAAAAKAQAAASSRSGGAAPGRYAVAGKPY